MDGGEGRFQLVTQEQAEVAAEHNSPVFQVGAQVTVNGSTFRVRKITRKDLILRLVSSR